MTPRDPYLKYIFYCAQGRRCAAPCDYRTGLGKHLPMDDLEWDHIEAESKGGPDTLGNLQLLCEDRNKIKSDLSMQHLHYELAIRRAAWQGLMQGIQDASPWRG
ncbi:MAG: HNH endonuclease signature motif containing protein [Gemmatimonadetes bacterium]|nr:HNH endonuclease signature motif containing protein [Gemmatimonadota bacterium]